MHISIKRLFLFQKSRLAGFFLCLLLGACQPAPEPVPGALEYGKAQQALQLNLPIKATEHLVTAIRQGHPGAVSHWLALTRTQLGPLQQYQQLLDWSVHPRSQEQHTVLGLWREAGIKPPQLSALVTSGSCQLRLQPVLSTALAVTHWQRLQHDWAQSAFASLPVCFLTPVLLDSRDLRCSEQAGERISCDTTSISQVMQQSQAQILLVIAGRGQASYNNGWLQLPENFSPALFRHEFSHALGFIDEYALAPQAAETECRRTDLLPNLLLQPAEAASYARHWGLALQELQLTPVDTCRTAGIQAWRPIKADSHMQHYEFAVPELYRRIMQQQLTKPQLLMPVQYYFAYLARQQQDMALWQFWMQQAAAFGYPAAQDALQAAGVSSTAR